MNFRWLVAVGLISGSAFADVPPRDAQCRADSQCVVVMSGGCCGTCCPTPVAMSVEDHQRQQRRCAVIDCAAPECGNVKCGRTEGVKDARAVCRSGQCALDRTAPKIPDDAECRADSDCELLTQLSAAEAQACVNTACGCCPAPARAFSKAAAAKFREQRPAEKKNGTQFGLSQGGAPDCQPCPPPPRNPVQASCESARCVVRELRPIPPG